MRLLTVLSWTAIVLGVVGILAGTVFHVPKGTHLGVFLIGAAFALGGVESLLTRRMSFRLFSDTSEAYAGVPAVIWGLMALLVGVAVIEAAYLMQAGQWRVTALRLLRHPGAVWSAVGLLLCGAGSLLMVPPDRRSSVAYTLLVRGPAALAGIALITGGILLAGIGVWEWYDPRGFDRYMDLVGSPQVRAVREAWLRLARYI